MHLKPDAISRILFTAAILLIAAVFCHAFYPGIWAHDSRAMLVSAALNNFFTTQPPFLQFVLHVLLKLKLKMGVVFVLQILLYWSAVLLICINFAQQRKAMLSLLTIGVALLPPNIYLHWVVIKDVGFQAMLLLFFGIFAHCNSRQSRSLILLIALFLLALIIILFRHNGFTVIPTIAIALATLWIEKGPNRSVKTIAAFICIASVLAIGAASINRVFVSKKGSISSEFLYRIAAKDLRGMSILAGHIGITQNLPENVKRRLSKAYFGNNLFFARQLRGTSDLYGNSSPEEIVKLWQQTVMGSPGLNVRHRWHIYSKLFDGSGESPKKFSYRQSDRMPMDFTNKLTLAEFGLFNIRPTSVAEMFVSFKHRFYTLLPSSWWILLLGAGIIVYSFFLWLATRSLGGDLLVALLMTSTAFIYCLPYLFIASHSEIRWVLPSNTLILFSLPFFLSSLFKKTRLTRCNT